MIPFSVKISGKKQIIMAMNVVDATIKAQRLLESKRMFNIPVRLRPLVLKNARRIK